MNAQIILLHLLAALIGTFLLFIWLLLKRGLPWVKSHWWVFPLSFGVAACSVYFVENEYFTRVVVGFLALLIGLVIVNNSKDV